MSVADHLRHAFSSDRYGPRGFSRKFNRYLQANPTRRLRRGFPISWIDFNDRFDDRSIARRQGIAIRQAGASHHRADTGDLALNAALSTSTNVRTHSISISKRPP